MPNDRRYRTVGRCYFVTVDLLEQLGKTLLPDLLRKAEAWSVHHSRPTAAPWGASGFFETFGSLLLNGSILLA